MHFHTHCVARKSFFFPTVYMAAWLHKHLTLNCVPEMNCFCCLYVLPVTATMSARRRLICWDDSPRIISSTGLIVIEQQTKSGRIGKEKNKEIKLADTQTKEHENTDARFSGLENCRNSQTPSARAGRCQHTIPLVWHLWSAFYSLAQYIRNVKSPVAVVIRLSDANWLRRLVSGARSQHQLCSSGVCRNICVPPAGVWQAIVSRGVTLCHFPFPSPDIMNIYPPVKHQFYARNSQHQPNVLGLNWSLVILGPSQESVLLV